MTKNLLSIYLALFLSLTLHAQFVYDDFEGNKHQYFGWMSGAIDTSFTNPSPNAVNSSATCAKYVRDSLLFDYITIYPSSFLTDLTPYNYYNNTAPKFKMKLYSTAPIGTFIELQVGSASDSLYPSGIHSQFQAQTTVRNEWEEIVFNFAQVPPGSTVGPSEVNRISLLLYPYSVSRDTFYLDDLSGPEVEPNSILSSKANPFKLSITPNPASRDIFLNFEAEAGKSISINIYNHLGKKVKSVVNDQMLVGVQSIHCDLQELSNGLYYCTIDNGSKNFCSKIILHH